MAKHKLVDLAGTVVHDKLIPQLLTYFIANGADYLSRNGADDEALEIAQRIGDREGFDTREQVIDFIIQGLRDYRADPKNKLDPKHLKLMGFVNEMGYGSGELQAESFPDVPDAFNRWTQNDQGIWTYSNGSAREQKNLLRTSTEGDLSRYIEGYFDTNDVGSKTNPDSYKRISDQLDIFPCHFTFLSDRVEELDAAAKARMNVVLIERPGNKPVGEHAYQVAQNFDNIY